jgi:putative CRISPR-associated protein (TIGR02619 family)
MKRTILTTVGTSLLTNREDDRPWTGWRHKQPLPDANTVDLWLQNADPIKASAEAHTWYRLGLFDPDTKNQAEVVLIHSQTPDGQFCAERLVALAQAMGMNARPRQVDGLNYSDGQKFNRGLRQLARVVGEEIKRGQTSGTVELAATGGFKAEIAIANLVGAVSDTPVHYIYEQFTSLITIAPIPVMLRADWIGSGAGRKLLEAFESANDVIPISTIDSLLKQDERLLSLVEIDEGHAALNLLGEIALRLIETPHETWPTPTDESPSTKKRLDSADHHRPRGWEQIVDTIANSRYVTSIRYEGSAAGGCLKEASDNESDLIHRIDGSPALTLRISTTATTSGQRRLVQQLLRQELKI